MVGIIYKFTILTNGRFYVGQHESESVDSYKEGVYNSFNSGNTNGSKNGGDLLVGKTKQSKRKANEAILGDSRFKINTADGIIIY